MKTSIFLLPMAMMLLGSCDGIESERQEMASESATTLQEVAQMLSALPLQREQMAEVYCAVSASSTNGYDEEYTMKNLLLFPGAGVGEDPSATKSGRIYQTPIKDLIEEYLRDRYSTTKAGAADTEAAVRRYLDRLVESDVQIYWPFSDFWDGNEEPVITFNPCTDAETNVGYTLSGEEVIVSESYAQLHPVWVVNVNDDSGYVSYEMLQKDNPDWGQGGSVDVGIKALSGSNEIKSLILRDFKMSRNYDPWFCGASEFFIKCGSVENFKATSEEDLMNYTPSVTDFMVVVKRRQAGETIPLNVLLVSEWTEQLEDVAFMITEDDGGTKTSWKMEAVGKVNSKSYGITIDIPLRSRDDIVWRGMLSRNYLEKNSGKSQHFGDVDVTLTLF